MSIRVSAGGFPVSATRDQLCRLPATHGEVESVSTSAEDQFTDRFREFGASVELESEVAEPQPAPTPTPAARPTRWAGTLPGVMAGKRPAPKPIPTIVLR